MGNNKIFVPETLAWCKKHYVPKNEKYITCPCFGNTDGMNGSCHWCMEMTPYEFEMCSDESWLRGLMRGGRFASKTKDDSINFINDYKQRHKLK